MKILRREDAIINLQHCKVISLVWIRKQDKINIDFDLGCLDICKKVKFLYFIYTSCNYDITTVTSINYYEVAFCSKSFLGFENVLK